MCVYVCVCVCVFPSFFLFRFQLIHTLIVTFTLPTCESKDGVRAEGPHNQLWTESTDFGTSISILAFHDKSNTSMSSLDCPISLIPAVRWRCCCDELLKHPFSSSSSSLSLSLSSSLSTYISIHLSCGLRIMFFLTNISASPISPVVSPSAIALRLSLCSSHSSSHSSSYSMA